MNYEPVICPNCGQMVYMEHKMYIFKSKNNIPYLCSLQCKAEWIAKTIYSGVL